MHAAPLTESFMANKSKLLESVLSNADKMVRADGKRGISADYFMTSLLGAIAAPSDGEGAKCRGKELENIKNHLSRYGTDIGYASEKMKKFVSENRSESALGGFLFNKIVFAAEAKALELGKDEVGADLYLELILADPTEAIKEFVMNPSRNRPSAAAGEIAVTCEPVAEQEDEEQTDPSAEALAAMARRRAAAHSGTAQKGATAKKGASLEELLTSVDKVKTVQQKLLASVYGQDHAVDTLVSGYFQAELLSLTQEKRTRPRATFLFAGPPGVGKTFLAEQVAEVLGLPYRRFDMSEYCEKESNLQFAGSDKVYKNAQRGIVTSFVDKNPKCILLFDEVEKAHLNVIHLFLQILDAGRIRDNYTAEEVSFADAILIFTTNAGKKLYDDPTIANLSSVARKSVLNALSLDINPETGAALFPAALCSRFASGNVIMFNHLDAHDLLKIVDKELSVHAQGFCKRTGIDLKIDKNVPFAIMFSEGGKVDARAIRGKSTNFLYQELYELFRIISSDKNDYKLENIKSVSINVSLPDDEKIRSLFAENADAEVLVFAEGDVAKECKRLLKAPKAHIVSTVEEAKDVLFKYDISLILCDVTCKTRSTRDSVLNLEDIDSEGRDFFAYVKEYVHTPLYLLEADEGFISQEEGLSFAREGARGIIALHKEGKYDFAGEVRGKCNMAHQQHNLLELAKASKAVTYQTAQRVSMNGEHAEIVLFDFKLGIAVDAEDNKNVLSNVSKPDKRFADVIGAEDAKDELKYFVEFLKNPARFIRSGVKAPKGILLYGPPGTGKTLLAQAMAGESDVTFIAAEGNQFLKKYVGEGPESVHALFNTARKYAPSILFVDEIDAIGKSRDGSDAAYSADVLTAFLTEMDGFNVKSDKPVFVLAATNYDINGDNGARSLDPALVRRFDNKIMVDLPNKAERGRYIKMKADAHPAISVSDGEIDNIAMRSTGMSLAELELVIELALRNSVKTEGFTVTDEILENAFEEFNSGEVKKWAPEELERTARHEAGHALLCWLSGETPSYLTVVARANHGGYMQHGDNEDKGSYTKEELLARIRTSLGGRAAETVYYGDEEGVSTGASGDLLAATRTAEHMICSYGMDDIIGLGCVDRQNIAATPYYSEIRKRVNDILTYEYMKARKAISDNRAAVDKLVETLMLKNHIKGPEIDEILSALIKK